VTRYNAVLAKFLEADEAEWEAVVATYRGDLQVGGAWGGLFGTSGGWAAGGVAGRSRLRDELPAQRRPALDAPLPCPPRPCCCRAQKPFFEHMQCLIAAAKDEEGARLGRGMAGRGGGAAAKPGRPSRARARGAATSCRPHRRRGARGPPSLTTPSPRATLAPLPQSARSSWCRSTGGCWRW
jgi:hypothetical protein